MIRVVAILTTLLIVSGCAPTKPMANESAIAQECVGGFMARRGLAPWPICVIPYKDGGKQCSDKAECEGKCLIEYGGVFNSRPVVGAPASGQCQAEQPAIGCYAELRKGIVATGFLCAD